MEKIDLLLKELEDFEDGVTKRNQKILDSTEQIKSLVNEAMENVSECQEILSNTQMIAEDKLSIDIEYELNKELDKLGV